MREVRHRYFSCLFSRKNNNLVIPDCEENLEIINKKLIKILIKTYVDHTGFHQKILFSPMESWLSRSAGVKYGKIQATFTCAYF